MKTKGYKLFTKGLMLALGMFLMLPMFAVGVQAQTRQEQREERREDRQERREDRRDARRGRNWDRYGNYGGSFQLRQTALNAGYNEGIKVGRSDSNRRGRANYRNTSAYRNASKDYSSRLGNKALYQRYYREGFENGYNDGLNGN